MIWSVNMELRVESEEEKNYLERLIKGKKKYN